MKVGITGHQGLGDTESDWVEQELDHVLAALPLPLIGISSLAPGADQLFADAILKHGGLLEVVLPFAEYKSRDREDFKRLLALAARTETLEKQGTNEESYFAAGKRVVDLSDLVIAVWNSKPANGLGGTADVARYALQQKKRIIQLDPIRKTRREYSYDVFVSYRHTWPDASWVLKRLVPALESAGLKAWVDTRDGDLGQYIYSQTDELIKQSRHAICVISPSYTREEKKCARMVAVELRRLLELEHNHEGPPITPFWLRGEKIPDKLKDLTAFDWRKSRHRKEKWKRLLVHFGATRLESSPPACKEVCLQRWLEKSAYTVGIILVIAVMALSAYRVRHLQPTLPPPVRLTMQKIAGADVVDGMTVAASANIAGTIAGEIPDGAYVAIYTEFAETPGVWTLTGSTLLNGQNWIVNAVPFRRPLTRAETSTTIQALVLTTPPPENLTDDDLPSLRRGTIGELSSVTVKARVAQVKIDRFGLDVQGMFTVCGTATDFLNGNEQLFFRIDVHGNEEMVLTATQPLTASLNIHTKPRRYGKPLAVGNKFTVHVFLSRLENSGAFDPSNQTPLETKDFQVTPSSPVCVSH